MTAFTEHKRELISRVNEILPNARVELTSLPQCKEICLYLLNPEYPEFRLSREHGARLMAEPMFWLFCWASGQALARFLLDNPQMVRGKRVLDFGCGSGVVAIAAAKAGAQKVWACDLDLFALDAAALNCRTNGVSVEFMEDFKNGDAQPDMIIAADVLYDSDNMPLLNQFADMAAEVIIADSRVKRFDVRGYQKIAALESFTVPDLEEANEFRNVSIYFAGRADHLEILSSGGFEGTEGSIR